MEVSEKIASLLQYPRSCVAPPKEQRAVWSTGHPERVLRKRRELTVTDNSYIPKKHSQQRNKLTVHNIQDAQHPSTLLRPPCAVRRDGPVGHDRRDPVRLHDVRDATGEHPLERPPALAHGPPRVVAPLPGGRRGTVQVLGRPAVEHVGAVDGADRHDLVLRPVRHGQTDAVPVQMEGEEHSIIIVPIKK